MRKHAETFLSQNGHTPHGGKRRHPSPEPSIPAESSVATEPLPRQFRANAEPATTLVARQATGHSNTHASDKACDRASNKATREQQPEPPKVQPRRFSQHLPSATYTHLSGMYVHLPARTPTFRYVRPPLASNSPPSRPNLMRCVAPSSASAARRPRRHRDDKKRRPTFRVGRRFTGR